MLDNRTKIKQYSPTDIVAREYKHATYAPSVKPGDYSDLHVVKELVTLKNGDKIPNVLLIKDFQRDFGVTKPAYRNHEEKKEYEEISRLKLYKTNQSNLNVKIAQALGKSGTRKELQHSRLAESPYLYGSTIDSTTLIKHQYDIRWPDNRSTFTVGALDYETDMVNGTGDPIIGTFNAFGKHFLVADRGWLAEYKDPEKEIRDYIDKHLMEGCFKERGVTQEDITIHFTDHPVKLIKYCTDTLHKLSPDLVSIWNIAFDGPLMIETCKKYGARPEDILSDPAIPREYRRAEYKYGPMEKKKVGGRSSPNDPIDRFDFLYLTAGWQPVCAQRIYKKLRPTHSKEPSYALDAISKKLLKDFGKYKPPGTEHLVGGAFHVHMQKYEKIAYCAYALIDPALCTWIDEQTNDLAVSYPLQCYYSSLDTFQSGPRKNEDEMYFGLRKKGYLQCSVSGDMTTKWCSIIQNPNNFITLLEPHLCHPELGIKCIEEGDYNTLVAVAAFDIDVKGAYPTTGVTENISKATTRFEIVGYEHLDRTTQRLIGFHLSNSKVNAIELTKMVYQGPNLMQMLQGYLKHTDTEIDKDIIPDYDGYFDDSQYLKEIHGI